MPGKAAVAARAIVAAIHRETRMLGPPENPMSWEQESRRLASADSPANQKLEEE
jgi:hypothetical protein